MEQIRVVQYGLGPIGRELAKLVDGRPGLTLVGAIDVAPELVDRDLGCVLEAAPRGVIISDDVPGVLAKSGPDVVVHATGSSLEQVAPQIEAVVGQGVSVVSTCEELAWPFVRHPELSERLDRLASDAGVGILGTGVNPGFVMDKLVITLMAACQEVREVRVDRVVDAARRRGPLQRKVGAGLSVASFEELVAAGRVRHVGLTETAYMVSHVLGLSDPVVRTEIRPVVAGQDMRTDFLTVHRGDVAGVEQTATVAEDSQERVRLHLRMAVGAEGYDRIMIDGVPPIDMTIAGGVHGDRATIGVLINCIPAVLAARPGLHTMVDIPLRYWAAAGDVA